METTSHRHKKGIKMRKLVHSFLDTLPSMQVDYNRLAYKHAAMRDLNHAVRTSDNAPNKEAAAIKRSSHSVWGAGYHGDYDESYDDADASMR